MTSFIIPPASIDVGGWQPWRRGFRSLIITLEMPRIQQLLIHLFERKFGQRPAKYGLEENVDRNMVLWL